MIPSLEVAVSHATPKKGKNGPEVINLRERLSDIRETRVLGLVTSVRDPLARLSRLSYSSNSRVMNSVDPLNEATTYANDGTGNLTSVTNTGKTRLEADLLETGI